MIKADHTFIGKLVCGYYSGYKLEKAFNPIRIIGGKIDPELPILMISNHFSWWDGFIQHRLNRRLFKRRFHVMMLEEQLEKFTILNKGGAFSVRKNSRAIIESLNYCLELLQDKNNLVLIFPQGKIESLHTSRLQFERGLSYLITHSKKISSLSLMLTWLIIFRTGSLPCPFITKGIYPDIFPISRH